jgi:phosphatidylserine/phosphatidylglycerophosphate/cardiolipin synthase-like enzyme
MLDAGIRIYEWNGSMMHAKTAVADSEWARVGSTNLNLNSWVGNWELDVAIENRAIAHTLEAHYEDDLTHSTEIVAVRSRLSRLPETFGRQPARRAARRALRTATGVSQAVSAAVMGSRQLESWESAPLLTLGLILAGVAALGYWKPWALAWPAIVVAAWIGLSLLAQALGLVRRRRRE